MSDDKFISESDYRLYIPYVNRPDLLRKALDSVQELQPHITIIDNSPDGLPQSNWKAEIIRPQVPLLFFQTMNLILSHSRARGCKYAFFLHNDGEVHKGFAQKVLLIARNAMDNWGIIFTLYDVFACFNLKIVDEIGLWDNNLPWYFADIDYYRRLKLAGFKVIEAGQGVTHAASQTINSDPRLKFLNGITFPLHAAYYKAKWGGESDHETFTEPFDGKLPE